MHLDNVIYNKILVIYNKILFVKYKTSRLKLLAVLCLIIILCVFSYDRYYNQGSNSHPVRVRKVKKSSQLNYLKYVDRTDSRGCPNFPVATYSYVGRLGNVISSYANFIAIHWEFGYQLYLPVAAKKKLKHTFEDVTFPSYDTISHCNLEFHTEKDLDPFLANQLTCKEEKRNDNPLPCLPSILGRLCNLYVNASHNAPRWPLLKLHMEKLFPKHLRFKAEILKKVDKITNSLQLQQESVLVGVHVRRTDYAEYRMGMVEKPLVNETFFQTAMTMMTDIQKKKGKEVDFIIVSDDMKWCKKHFTGTNIHNVGGSSPAVDLALLAHCKASILDYGSYGVWGAVLTQGEVIIPASTSGNSAWAVRDLGWTALEGF